MQSNKIFLLLTTEKVTRTREKKERVAQNQRGGRAQIPGTRPAGSARHTVMRW